jgi:hypothetical protein
MNRTNPDHRPSPSKATRREFLRRAGVAVAANQRARRANEQLDDH